MSLPTITISNASVTPSATDKTTLTFTVTLSQACPTPITIQYATVAGTASSGAGDYTGVASGTLTITAGVVSAPIAIQVNSHKVGLPATTFNLQITQISTTGVIAQGTGTINSIPVPPPPPVIVVGPTVTVLNPSSPFQKIFSSLKGGESFKLQPGAAFNIPSPIQANAPFTLDGSGVPITFNEMTGSSSIFRVSHPGTELFNLNIQALPNNAQHCVFRVFAPNVHIHDSVIGDGFGTVCFADVGGAPLFENLNVGFTNSCSLYFCSPGAVARKVTFKGSYGETVGRCDASASDSNPANLIIDQCTIHSVAGKNQKGAWEWRQSGVGCQFTNNTMFDYVRAGQDSKTPGFKAGTSCAGLLIQGNKFMTMPPTVPEHLMLKGGIVAQIVDNDFIVDNIIQCTSVDGPSIVAFKNNRRHVAKGVTPRPKIYNPVNTPASAIVNDDGGSIVTM